MSEDNIDKIDQAVYSGAKAICRWLRSPGGDASFDGAVAEHLTWFQGAQARGMGWAAIVRVLSEAGVKRDNGRDLSQSHVRGVFSRKQNKTIPSKKAAINALLERYTPKPSVVRRQHRLDQTKKLITRHSDAFSPLADPAQLRRTNERLDRSLGKQPTRQSTPAEANHASKRNGIRSVLKRQQAIRKRSEDD